MTFSQESFEFSVASSGRIRHIFDVRSTIFVVPMAGATIAIDNASAADTILTVKHCVFAANRKLFVRRQRLVYQPRPYGMDALADDETLGGAGVARDGTAKLDVLLDELTEAQVAELGPLVLC